MALSKTYSPLTLGIGTIFQAVVGVWLPVILSLSVLYGCGYSHALSASKCLSGLAWIALIFMICKDCEILFAYSLVITLVLLSPPAGYELSRWSIFLAACGGATPAFFSSYLVTESAQYYEVWSLKNQEHALLRLLALLSRSPSVWPFIVLATDAASALILIGILYGFEGRLTLVSGVALSEQTNLQLDPSLDLFAFVPLLLVSLSTIVMFLCSLCQKVRVLKPTVLALSGIVIVDFGFDICWKFFPPYRDSSLNNTVLVFAVRYITVLILFSLFCLWRLEKEQEQTVEVVNPSD